MIQRFSPTTICSLAMLFVASYFLYFSLPSLRAEFSDDDLMNCYFAWQRPTGALLADIVLFFNPSPVYRPLGALIYKASFAAFGFNLLPLRLLLLLLLGGRVFLTYALTRQLTNSKEAGLIAALVGAFHYNTSHLLFNTGFMYDIFCCFLYFFALLYYVRARADGRILGPAKLGLVILILVLALDSKEMAVTLPVMIGIYELLYHPPSLRSSKDLLRWLWREGRTLCVGCGITTAFVIGRITGPASISQAGEYRPNVSAAEYLMKAGHYLSTLFYQADWLGRRGALVFLISSLTVALLLRSRSLLFSWALFVLGLLPLAFISPRGLDSAVIPATGLMIYGTVLLLRGRDRLLRALLKRSLRSGTAVRWKQIATVCAVTAFLVRVHPHSNFSYQAWVEEQYTPIRSFREQLGQLHPRMPRGSRVLIVQDPFPVDNHDPLFIGRLLYRDETLTVDRLKAMNPKPDGQVVAGYDFVFSFEDGKLMELDK